MKKLRPPPNCSNSYTFGINFAKNGKKTIKNFADNRKMSIFALSNNNTRKI